VGDTVRCFRPEKWIAVVVRPGVPTGAAKTGKLCRFEGVIRAYFSLHVESLERFGTEGKRFRR
jgi:hypothetical protein